eukprot:TRINITY_DN55534_c0_g1_i1.p2 TRINITY_DN55534_c0_g1~~TRINITY_DN55534_c0_g1_i1.p2  ORF type:complete len:126 (+),score=23.04 TRINITY_DN55534_c0_g1_i1:98-475(+)
MTGYQRVTRQERATVACWGGCILGSVAGLTLGISSMASEVICLPVAALLGAAVAEHSATGECQQLRSALGPYCCLPRPGARFADPAASAAAAEARARDADGRLPPEDDSGGRATQARGIGAAERG